MKFTHYQPTKVIFNELETLPELVLEYGKKCLLITPEPIEVLKPLFDRTEKILRDKGIEVISYNKVTPNPLTSIVDGAIELINENPVDVIVALGGGSSIDTAKVVSYYASNKGVNWNEVFSATNSINYSLVNKEKLPLIAIPTTSGTGSQCTQAAVITNTETHMKTTLFNTQFFPDKALVDPSLMMTLPYMMTAYTAFDAFCHLSEAYCNARLSPMLKPLCIDAMKNIITTLPKIKAENSLEHREVLAFSDTIAGIVLSNGGANIPHCVGEYISSMMPKVSHGASLAVVYKAFVEEYFENSLYSEGINDIILLINPSLTNITKDVAVKTIGDFLASVDLDINLTKFDITDEEKANVISCINEQNRFTDKDRLIRVIEKSM